nr:MAG TPA: hypothetical protein [Caudoviricetes sp.]
MGRIRLTQPRNRRGIRAACPPSLTCPDRPETHHRTYHRDKNQHNPAQPREHPIRPWASTDPDGHRLGKLLIGTPRKLTESNERMVY